MFRYLVCHLFMGVLLVFSALANAESPRAIFYGVGFNTGNENIADDFPYSAELGSAIEAKATSIVESLVAQNKLKFTKADNLDEGDVALFALMIDSETAYHEKICGDYKTTLEIAAQIAVFELNDKVQQENSYGATLIRSYPFVVQHIGLTKSKPDRSYYKNIAENLYLGHWETNILNTFSEKLYNGNLSGEDKYINLRAEGEGLISISKVVVGRKAQGFLPERLSSPEGLDLYKGRLARRFASMLSNEYSVPIVPYTSSTIKNKKLKMQFSNTAAINLTIPSPNVGIEFAIGNFKRQVFDEKAAGKSIIYGVYTQIKASVAPDDPDYSELIFKSRFKQAVSKIVPTCQSSINEWAIYDESVSVLMQQFVRQIYRQDRHWAEDAGAAPDFKTQINKLKRIIDQEKSISL